MLVKVVIRINTEFVFVASVIGILDTNVFHITESAAQMVLKTFCHVICVNTGQQIKGILNSTTRDTRIINLMSVANAAKYTNVRNA